MKGQYRIIVEIMIVLVGIFLTGFIISSFSTVQGSATNISSEDTFGSVANNVVIGVLKASLTNNTIVRLNLPSKVSDQTYKIRLDEDENEISVTDLKNNFNVRRKIFNISLANRVITSEAVSSAGEIEIINDANGIKIRRVNR